MKVENKFVITEEEAKECSINLLGLLAQQMGYNKLSKPVKLVVKDRETLIRFSDDTYRVAKCEENDQYDLKTGVIIGLLKRMGANHKEILSFIELVKKEELEIGY